MSSSDDSALFDDNDSNEASDEQPMDPPDYVKSAEFQLFVKRENVRVDDRQGYIYIHLYKPFYFPGEIVRGSIIIDLFNPLPKKVDEIKLKFYGYENVGKHTENVREVLKKQQALKTTVGTWKNKSSGSRSGSNENFG